MNEKRNTYTLLPMLADIICIIAGLAMYFVSGFEMKYVSVAIFGALIVSGIITVVFYFTREAYKKVMDYSFSAGILMIALACCVLARIDDISLQMDTILEVAALTLAIVLLQNALQMKILGSRIWVLALICSLILIGVNVVLIIEPSFIKSYQWDMLCFALMLTGALGLIFMALVKLEIKLEPKRTEKQKAKAEEAARKAEEAAKKAEEEAKEKELLEENDSKSADENNKVQASAEYVEFDSSSASANVNENIETGDENSISQESEKDSEPYAFDEKN